MQIQIQKQTQYSANTNTTTVERQVARSLIIELSRLGQLHTSLSLVKNQTYSESIFSSAMPAKLVMDYEAKVLYFDNNKKQELILGQKYTISSPPEAMIYDK